MISTLSKVSGIDNVSLALISFSDIRGFVIFQLRDVFNSARIALSPSSILNLYPIYF